MISNYSGSHIAAGKGAAYDADFEASRFLTYLWDQERTLVLELLRNEDVPDGGAAFLDFACGTGRVLGSMERHCRRAVGVDVSREMLRIAQGKVRSAELVLADVRDEEVDVGGPFNVATAFRFFPNADPALRRRAAQFLSTHLVRGGLLIVNNHQNASSALCRLGALIGKKWAWSPYPNAHLVALLEENGFVLEGSRSFGVLPGTARRLYAPRWCHAMADGLAHQLGFNQMGQDVVLWFRRM